MGDVQGVLVRDSIDSAHCDNKMVRSQTGLARLGFGCAHFSPRMSTSQAVALLERALDCGISHFDTARMYGSGAAEGMLGQLAKRRRAEMTLVSKAGISPRGRAERALGAVKARLLGSPAPGLFRFNQFAAAQVRRSVEASLRELRTDHLDALLLHECAPAHITDELKRLLAALKQEGKVKRVGIATPTEHSAAIAYDHPDLCEIIQIAAPPPGAPLPSATTVILHSVLGSRLTRLVATLRDDAALARSFVQELDAEGRDPETTARLFLAYEMTRNHDGVVLVSSLQARHIEQNAALLTAPPDHEQLAAFDRFLSTLEIGRVR
jgi:D-threo-aldose 1-dehydrogenase